MSNTKNLELAAYVLLSALIDELERSGICTHDQIDTIYARARESIIESGYPDAESINSILLTRESE